MRLTDNDIQNLYIEFATPAHVKAHCKGVTTSALKIAHALMDCGYEGLDLELIYGAGMIHDMARIYDHHEIVAADKLFELGFTEEAGIVREHMRKMTYHDIDHVTEADLLYISDRMVIEDTFVGVEKRFEYIRDKMIKHGVDPDSEMSRRNRQNSFDFVAAIESKTHMSMFELQANVPAVH